MIKRAAVIRFQHRFRGLGMTELTYLQHQTVVNAFSFVIGATGVAAVLFLAQRQAVLPRYRTGIALLGLVSLAAACNHTRLLASWRDSFQVVHGAVRATGVHYDDVYRYAD